MPADQMLIATQCHRWKNAKLLRLPFGPLEPVVWVDDANCMCAFHPVLLGETRQSIQTGMVWDAEMFAKVANQVVRGSGALIRERMAERGYPEGFYSDYPNIVRKMQQGDHSFAPKYDAEKEAKKS